MTRPDPNALLPGVSFSSPSADVGTAGNPNLKPYISENLDLGIEHFMGGPSYWAVTTFRKRLTGFTVNSNITHPFSYLAPFGINYNTLSPTAQGALTARCGQNVNDPGCTIVLTQQVNQSSALTIHGLEFDWVQSLDPLVDYMGLRALDGLGFTFNFTLIDQSVTPGASPALGVAPHSYNVSAYYEKSWFSVRLSSVFNAGSQVAGLNQNGIPLAGLFSDDYQQFDFSSYLDLGKLLGWGKGAQVTFDVLNLTDAKQRTYFQFTNATFTQYDAGRTFMVGIRGQF
jgi:TonB-dependent receptor